jgi:hypothetical protein
MADKRISELTTGNTNDLNAAAFFPADTNVSSPGTGATQKFSASQLSQALLQNGPLADYLQNIKNISSKFRGYYSDAAPSDPAKEKGYLWWRGSLASMPAPSSFPVNTAYLSEWSGSAWVQAVAPYTPDAYDRWGNVNSGVNYFYSPAQSNWVIDSVSGDGVNIGVNAAGKLYLIDASITLSKLYTGVQNAINGALQKAGGTMIGTLSLIAPSDAAHAARKQDVDSAAAALNADVTALDGAKMPNAPSAVFIDIADAGSGYSVGNVVAYTNRTQSRAMVASVDSNGGILAASDTSAQVAGGGAGAQLQYSYIDQTGAGAAWHRTNHNRADGRSYPNAHPMSAISGLAKAVNDMNAATTALEQSLAAAVSALQAAKADKSAALPAIPWATVPMTVPPGRIAVLDASKTLSYRRETRPELFFIQGGEDYAAGDALQCLSSDNRQSFVDKMARVTDVKAEVDILAIGSGYAIGDVVETDVPGRFADVLDVTAPGGVLGAGATAETSPTGGGAGAVIHKNGDGSYAVIRCGGGYDTSDIVETDEPGVCCVVLNVMSLSIAVGGLNRVGVSAESEGGASGAGGSARYRGGIPSGAAECAPNGEGAALRYIPPQGAVYDIVSGGSGYAVGDIIPTTAEGVFAAVSSVSVNAAVTGVLPTGGTATSTPGINAVIDYRPPVPQHIDIENGGRDYVLNDKLLTDADGRIAIAAEVDGGVIVAADVYAPAGAGADAYYQSPIYNSGEATFFGLPSNEEGVFFGVLVPEGNDDTLLGRFRLAFDGTQGITSWVPIDIVWRESEAQARNDVYIFTHGVTNASPVSFGGDLLQEGTFDVLTDVSVPAIGPMQVEEIRNFLVTLYQDTQNEKAGRVEVAALYERKGHAAAAVSALQAGKQPVAPMDGEFKLAYNGGWVNSGGEAVLVAALLSDIGAGGDSALSFAIDGAFWSSHDEFEFTHENTGVQLHIVKNNLAPHYGCIGHNGVAYSATVGYDGVITLEKVGMGSQEIEPALIALDAAVAAADEKAESRLPLGGGTMTGPLILNADPVADLEAATKAYADKSPRRIYRTAPNGQVAPFYLFTLQGDFAGFVSIAVLGRDSPNSGQFTLRLIPKTTNDKRERMVIESSYLMESTQIFYYEEAAGTFDVYVGSLNNIIPLYGAVIQDFTVSGSLTVKSNPIQAPSLVTLNKYDFNMPFRWPLNQKIAFPSQGASTNPIYGWRSQISFNATANWSVIWQAAVPGCNFLVRDMSVYQRNGYRGNFPYVYLDPNYTIFIRLQINNGTIYIAGRDTDAFAYTADVALLFSEKQL